MASDQASHARRRLEFQKSYSLEVNFTVIIITIIIIIIIIICSSSSDWNSFVLMSFSSSASAQITLRISHFVLFLYLSLYYFLSYSWAAPPEELGNIIPHLANVRGDSGGKIYRLHINTHVTMTAPWNTTKTRQCGNYSDVLPLKAARRDSINSEGG